MLANLPLSLSHLCILISLIHPSETVSRDSRRALIYRFHYLQVCSIPCLLWLCLSYDVRMEKYLKNRIFSNLIGEKDPRIPGVKESRVCFLKTLSVLLIFFRFQIGLFSVYLIQFFQLNLNPLLIVSVFPIRKPNHKICKTSECNPWLSFFHGEFCCYSIYL